MTGSNALSMVTVKQPRRSVLASDRETWKPSKGITALGSGLNQ
jgi:hypothetical protein